MVTAKRIRKHLEPAPDPFLAAVFFIAKQVCETHTARDAVIPARQRRINQSGASNRHRRELMTLATHIMYKVPEVPSRARFPFFSKHFNRARLNPTPPKQIRSCYVCPSLFWTVGAAGDEAAAEAWGPPEPDTSRGQIGAQSREVVLARGEAVGHFLWLRAGRAARRCGTGGTALSGQA
jgi:hypothetical protein